MQNSHDYITIVGSAAERDAELLQNTSPQLKTMDRAAFLSEKMELKLHA